MKLPKHEASLHLTHNQHKAYYMTVQQAVLENNFGYGEDDWVSDEQREKAIATNECWTLQWYPDTPVGFHKQSAADLNVLLAACSDEDSTIVST